MIHVDDPAGLGRRLRHLRAQRGLSQRALAFDGCTAAFLSRVETGERQPSPAVIDELARRLDVSTAYLTTGELDEVDRGLEAAGLTLGDLTDQERATLELELERARFETARGVALAFLQLRRAGLELEASR